MKNFIFILLSLITILPPTSSNASGAKHFYSEEEGAYFEIPPPPRKKIESQDIYRDLSQGRGAKLTFAPPKDWPVRAIYIELAKEIVEFDRQGHIFYDGGEPHDDPQSKREHFSMEQIFLNGKPFWIGAKIFRRIGTSNREDTNPVFATMPTGIIQSKNGKFCPVRELKSRKIFGLNQYTLDGDCDTAIQVTIHGGRYWIYPAFKKIKEPYFYWKIQYFSDPVEPFPSAGEGCLLYCDDASRKAAEERSKAN